MIPLAFTARKNKIVEALAVPDEDYTDLSPKGSVDEGIKALISQINGLDGLVTTSSCGGRISVFLEGSKSDASPSSSPDLDTELHASAAAAIPGSTKPSTVPGGKGKGGRWLFVSHDPVALPGAHDRASTSVPDALLSRFHLLAAPRPATAADRLVRLQFEPMILHIMAASLGHAQQLLAAAVGAGFRESGLQSLRILDDVHASPMVAVRSAGLALSSVVGFGETGEDGGEAAYAIVPEHYLRLMVELGNARFADNARRIARFERGLEEAGREKGRAGAEAQAWEDRGVRAARKRAEGLARRAALQMGEDRESGDGRSVGSESDDMLINTEC